MNTVTELLAEIEQLREENRQLRQVLEPDSHPPYNLTRAEGIIYRCLLRNGYASKGVLIDSVALSINSERCTEETLRVYISNIRKKLQGVACIRNVFGLGYMMENV